MKVMYYARDSVINSVLTSLNMSNTLLIYNYATASPAQIVIGIIASKFSLSKTAVALIIIFLL